MYFCLSNKILVDFLGGMIGGDNWRVHHLDTTLSKGYAGPVVKENLRLSRSKG